MSLICRFYCDQSLGRKPFQLNRGNPKWSQTWRANYANSYMYCDTFWLQLCNHLAHFIVFWQIKWKNLYVTVPLQTPGRLYSEGWFNERLFALRVSGPYTQRGLYSEFYGMLRFIQQGAQKCNLLYFYADINQSESGSVSSWLLIGLNLYQRSE